MHDLYRNARCHRQAGFTMVELMIVIAVIAILTAIAVPNIISWLPNYRLKAAARDLYSNMQKARMQAVKENKDWAIVFNPVNNNYMICSDRGPDNSWGNFGDNRIVETLNLNSYKSGVGYGHGSATTNATKGGGPFPGDNVSFSSNVVTFSPKGLCKSGYCYLSNSKNTAYAISSLTSGIIHLKKWYGTKWR